MSLETIKKISQGYLLAITHPIPMGTQVIFSQLLNNKQ